ncbi:MAG: aminotransferase class V-fold PLP-dependent enzyme [Oscillospiraceae bacterium]|nr:aminotransferase class V-fold PLP-dependent enzyme [Oscillospiraceae bacterium]
MKKYSFKNDYSSLAHYEVLSALSEAVKTQHEGYSEDIHSQNAAALIKCRVNQSNVDVHFVSGGTIANLIVFSAILRPHEAVIACDSGHISTHEAGAIEGTGHKICTVSSVDGKLTAAQIESVVLAHTDEHMVKPKAVFISQSTELGTVYTKSELCDIYASCRANDLYLYIDGARIAAAINSRVCDMTYSDIAESVDVFYLGGTKNGALLGEAIVICNDDLKKEFRHIIKQRGGMLAKGATIGVQFEALFKNNLYDDLAKHSNAMAYRLAEGIKELGYEFLVEVESNQIFPIFPSKVVEKLMQNYDFHEWVKLSDKTAIRLVTSFDTHKSVIDEFLDELSCYS